jgi:23S rRNA (guanosine2251-2'-O)-methyltransferase
MKTYNEILFGIHPVKEALVAQKRAIKHIYITKNMTNNRLHYIASLAQNNHIQISYIAQQAMNHKTGTEQHQNVAALVSRLPLLDIHSITAKNAFIIICDHLQDPHNMGALMRTALAVGAKGFISTRDHSSPFSPMVSKISAGAMEHLPVARVTNLVRTIKQLKTNGFWIMGLNANAQQSLYEVSLKGRIALVIGGEEKGIRRLVQESCDLILKIPQMGPLDSLNASVAGAVAMYEIFRQIQ